MVEDALDRYLKTLPEDLASSPLAASAAVMARLLDDPNSSTTSRSMCMGQFREALRELRDLAPPKEEKDAVDRLKQRNARRVERRAASQGLARP